MPDLPFFQDLVLAIAAALLGGVVARRLGLPSLLGYLLGGVLIGPYTPGPVSEIRHVSTLAEMGVVLLMFEAGVEFPVERLRRVKAVAVGGGLIVVLVIGAIAVGIGSLLGFPSVQQVFFGAIVSLSSTMVAIKMLLDRGEMDTPHGEVTVGIALVEDLCLITMLVLLPAWATAQEEVWRPLLLALGNSLGLFAGAYAVGRLLLPPVFSAVARLRSRELFLLAAVLVVIGTTVGLAAVGLHAVLGAYLAGVLVSRSYYSRHVLAELVASRDLFASLFFVSMGMLVDPGLLLSRPLTLLAVVGVILLLRPLVVASTVRLFGHAAPTALMTGVLLAQIGELSFVLAKLGVDRGFISGELYGLILGSALISILVNPLWIRGGAAWARRRRATARRPAEPEGRLEGVARLADHVVICGCGRVGSAVVERLRAQEIPYVVIELDAVRIEELRRKGEPYLFGDASSLYILRSAGIERARLLAITYNDPVASELTIRRVLELCPSLKVIARAHRAADVGRLRSAGAAEVVYPEFEAGLEFVRWTLEEIGVSVEGIEDLIRRGRDAFSPVRNPDGPPEHTGPGT